VTDSGSIDKGVLGTINEKRSHPTLSRLSANIIAQEGSNKQSLTPKRQRQNLPQLDLRRRNSDPATKVLINEHTGKLIFFP